MSAFVGPSRERGYQPMMRRQQVQSPPLTTPVPSPPTEETERTEGNSVSSRQSQQLQEPQRSELVPSPALSSSSKRTEDDVVPSSPRDDDMQSSRSCEFVSAPSTIGEEDSPSPEPPQVQLSAPQQALRILHPSSEAMATALTNLPKGRKSLPEFRPCSQPTLEWQRRYPRSSAPRKHHKHNPHKTAHQTVHRQRRKTRLVVRRLVRGALCLPL
ncbi:hypothetical protein M011DRAFT_175365 [Sporormia fimetaria CBS 119925]|uniref:Uncharacterized protein n=1 Tax=Sporormia fimetaria CBS 119925 TaxID=1340428 RepID=A0A6A6VN58_9PLEO|nr:hypothetical protein M011DRAFT_175365 [Sporormia fimetaria CBS 119925]